MTSPLAGIRWLRDAINLGGRNPRTLLLAAALVLVCGLVPSLFTTALQFLFPNNPAMFIVAMVLSILFGLALSPIFAGFLQVIHAIETGQPTRARAIFAPYRTGVWKPVIGFSLLLWGVYACAFGLVVLAAGADGRALYADMWTAATTHVPMAPHAEVPPGLLRAFAVACICVPIIAGCWVIGYGQVAIGRQRVVASFVDGLTGTLKNIPSMIVLLIAWFLLGIVLLIVFLIVAAILGLVAKLVAAWLAVVLLVPLYIALLLGLYIVGGGVAYAMWREICAP
ncbi:hypothetical protein AB4059_02615 [Lysobacter sp. 2RAF19]